MNTEPIVAALDIGTAWTTAVVAAVHGDLPRAPMLRILGVGRTRTQGLRRGVVSDIEEATRSIRKAVEEASKVSGVVPESLYVGIAGEHVRTLTGTQSIQWDLRNSSGERVASGIYIYLLTANNEQKTG